MKEKYISPEIDIVKFGEQDIITTSNFTDNGFEGEEDRFW